MSATMVHAVGPEADCPKPPNQRARAYRVRRGEGGKVSRSRTHSAPLAWRLAHPDHLIRARALEDSAKAHAERVAAKGWGSFRPTAPDQTTEGVRPTLALLAESYPGAFRAEDVAERLDADRITARAGVDRDPEDLAE
jgi:hypothetical protein